MMSNTCRKEHGGFFSVHKNGTKKEKKEKNTLCMCCLLKICTSMIRSWSIVDVLSEI